MGASGAAGERGVRCPPTSPSSSCPCSTGQVTAVTRPATRASSRPAMTTSPDGFVRHRPSGGRTPLPAAPGLLTARGAGRGQGHTARREQVRPDDPQAQAPQLPYDSRDCWAADLGENSDHRAQYRLISYALESALASDVVAQVGMFYGGCTDVACSSESAAAGQIGPRVLRHGSIPLAAGGSRPDRSGSSSNGSLPGGRSCGCRSRAIGPVSRYASSPRPKAAAAHEGGRRSLPSTGAACAAWRCCSRILLPLRSHPECLQEELDVPFRGVAG